MSISLKELFHDHNAADIPIAHQQNLQELQTKVNKLIEYANWHPAIVTSAYRSEQDQLRINPKAVNSAHRVGMAVDIQDKDGAKIKWLKANVDKLEELGLYVEDGTVGWVHIQTRPTKNRFFKP